jgi:hypothetical protein
MKTIKIFFLLGLLFCFLNSCGSIFDSVLSSNRKGTLEGVLYNDCNLKPVPNVNLEIWDMTNNSAEKGYGKTNDKGEFKIEFKGTLKGNYSVNAIPANGGGFGTNEVGTFVPQTQNITGYKAYFDLQTTVNIRLKTNRIFTQNDTLYITETNVQNAKKYIAPQDGQLVFSVNRYVGSKGGYAWGIGYTSFVSALNNNINGVTSVGYDFPTVPCQIKELTIEIK